MDLFILCYQIIPAVIDLILKWKHQKKKALELENIPHKGSATNFAIE